MAVNIKIGITGVPRAGKTLTLIKVIHMLEKEGKVVGGIITEPIMRGKERIGFRIMNWLTKEEDILAHIKKKSKVMVGKYGVNLEALERIGVKAIEDAIERADIIVIDEVGKMEVESESFIEVIKKALECDKPLILTLHKKSRNPLLQDIRRRDDVRILEVTPINRNLLPYKIVKLLKEEFAQP